MNKEDPCEDVRGEYVICTSNVEEVRTIGKISMGIGAAAIIFGIIRYSEGAKKARTYDEWKRNNNLLFRPQLKFDKDQIEIAMTIDF